MKLKPKILFLLHLPPPVHGSSIMGINIKNSTIINDTFESVFVNLLASKEVAESGKISLRKVLGSLNIFSKVLKILLAERPKVCYLALTSTGAAFYKDLIIVAFLKLLRVKRIYHMHNKGVSLYQQHPIYRISYKFVFTGADVILLSKNLYSDIQAFVPESNVHICPNGISDEIHACTYDGRISGSLYAPDYSLSKKKVSILFISNLIKAKGVYVLLEACALLKQNGLPFRCTFIGNEGDISRSEFTSKVDQLHLSEQVNYLGKRFGEEKHKAFSQADVFVFPTYFETFGLVNLEAMQHSLPIVSTLEGGIPDIIEDNVTGFLVPPQNANALSEKLEVLINDANLREQMGKAGRKRYEQEFTFEIFERRLTSILLRVANRN